MNPSPSLCLASSSPFRAKLLKKLHLNFATHSPDIDETPHQDESVLEMVNRLSLAKAQAVAAETDFDLIIASDQSACFQGQALGKPGNLDRALAQLKAFSGQTVNFYTGLVVLDQRTGQIQQTHDETKVSFRTLSEYKIKRYLEREQPYQCAGSFKSEGLGITLFERIETQDPNALIGLPLIQLTGFLEQAGINI